MVEETTSTLRGGVAFGSFDPKGELPSPRPPNIIIAGVSLGGCFMRGRRKGDRGAGAVDLILPPSSCVFTVAIGF